MKRWIIIAIVASLLLVISTLQIQKESQVVVTEEAEFSVRFHSFGKNATINLKEFLGESARYLVSKTENVIVKIDQGRGIAYLEAKPGWEGTELIFFKTIESQPIIKEEEEEEEKEEEKPPPFVLEGPLEAVEYESPLRLFGGTIDTSVMELLKDIRREEIKKLSKKIQRNKLEISINDEIDFRLEKGYTPKITMNFSLGPQQEEIEIEPKKEERKVLKTKISFTIALIGNILLFLLAIFAIYSYIRHRYPKSRQPRKIKKEGSESIDKNIKHSTLFKLRTLQENLGKDSPEEFLGIIRDFFSRYFGIDYNFELKELTKKIKDSDLNESKKERIIDFTNILSKEISTYSANQIPEEYLQKLILKMKKIIRSL